MAAQSFVPVPRVAECVYYRPQLWPPDPAPRPRAVDLDDAEQQNAARAGFLGGTAEVDGVHGKLPEQRGGSAVKKVRDALEGLHAATPITVASVATTQLGVRFAAPWPPRARRAGFFIWFVTVAQNYTAARENGAPNPSVALCQVAARP